MSTRSNIIVVKSDGALDQFYHHCDGYLYGVGEELRKKMIYSIGMNHFIKDVPPEDILDGELMDTSGYEYEHDLSLNGCNSLHADIEYLYIIKDCNLYYVHAWGLYEKVNTNSELIDFVCKDENLLPLDKPIKRGDNR